MSKLYHSRRIPATQPRAVVAHCSDPRYQPHFQDFLHNGLRLTHYALIAVPGGAQFLCESETSESVRKGMKWVEFVTKLINADHCVLIGHADCRWYLDNRIERHPERLKERQAADLGKLRDRIRKRFPAVRVELYYAQLQGEETFFEPL